MINKVIVMDSCVYFRFGILLSNLFEVVVIIEGLKYSLKIHDDVMNEYNQQVRLKNKYPKITPLPIPTKNYIIKPKPKEVENYQNFIEEINLAEQYLKFTGKLIKTPSATDKNCLALQKLRPDTLLVCSDDSDVNILANELEIKTLRGSELIEILLINKAVTNDQVLKWFIYLKSIDDYPKSYIKIENRIK